MAERSNLPAPYESPWRQLGRAAAAVLASLRLDLRFAWRQNRQGNLPTPSWWPRAIASLFWPLVLSAAVALMVGLGSLAIQARSMPPDATAGAPTAVAPAVEPPAVEPPAVASDQVPTAVPQRTAPQALEQEPAAISQPDPLLERFNQAAASHWVMAARTEADQGLLLLELDAAFCRLSLSERQQQSAIWLEQSRTQGYDHLELRRSDGRRCICAGESR